MNTVGQALLETVFSIVIFMMLLGYSIRFFSNEYQRLLCEKKLFDEARNSININHHLPALSHRAKCGMEEITITLRRLEDGSI